MERPHAQENLAHLVNIEALLGKLSTPKNGPAAPAVKTAQAPQPELIPLVLKWPREVLSLKLCERISARNRANAGQTTEQVQPSLLGSLNDFHLHRAAPHTTAAEPLQKLNRLFELLTTDVLAARDRLLMLNPGRRKLIEHRLDYIGRKTARLRGERLNRSLSLPEVLKESYRDSVPGTTVVTAPKLGIAAWRGFVSEVALYNLMELFFLKGLDVYGWRNFEPADLGRMNFAAHTFLGQRAVGFAHDKHCWNFVRTNLYSWYVPSQKALAEMTLVLDELQSLQFTWSDRDLAHWVAELPTGMKLLHMDFADDARTAGMLTELLENQLATSLTSKFQGRPVCKKFFVPALELGGVALSLLDRLLFQIRQSAPNAFEGGVADESSQLHRAVWACEGESFEVFWTEVLALLKILRSARSTSDYAGVSNLTPDLSPSRSRLPHAMHVVNALGLELHNMDQLPLGGPEVSKLQQGSAAQIQQLEAFDVALVTDNPDRTKSAAWMKALAQQLPYWRTLVGTGTNLNWGELHLHLAATKLKENGLCVYLSHRALPEGGDGEKLRKSVLNLCTLDYFLELPEDAYRPYRYIYIFRRVSKKLDRDQHRPRFGHLKTNLSNLEEASSTQAEIAERGWDHLFVRGAAPLIRHLNHKFPKLFQIATVGESANIDSQTHAGRRGAGHSLLMGADTKGLEMSVTANGDLQFQPANSTSGPARDALMIYPHNPLDLPWIGCLLNSAPAQFWIRQQLLATAGSGKAPRYQELRSCPVVDLSHTPSDMVNTALEWMAETKPDAATLRTWACHRDSPLTERYSRFVAMAKQYSSLERIVSRYRPLFTGPTFEELKHDSVGQFYPNALLCHLSQSPDLRIQYADRARSNLMPENWIIEEVRTLVKDSGPKAMAYLVAQTRQGPSIQILAPLPIRDYLKSQLTALAGHTWGEALSMLRVPRDVPLFAAQCLEITRVVSDTAREMAVYHRVIEELALDLFEIPADVRQFLPH